jgi:threonine dehydrogenase-like Zn-dependent dehydrogenase
LDLGGRASLIGVVNQSARDFVPALVTLKDLTLHGILHGLDYYDQTVNLFASGRVDPTKIVERVGPADETELLFQQMTSGNRKRPKYRIEFAGEHYAA